MAVNKVVFGGETVIDLTKDTVTPDTLAEGVTAHDASGAKIIGTMASGGGGGSGLGTCEVVINPGFNISYQLIASIVDSNGNVVPYNKSNPKKVTLKCVCGSAIVITSYDWPTVEVSDNMTIVSEFYPYDNAVIGVPTIPGDTAYIDIMSGGGGGGDE